MKKTLFIFCLLAGFSCAQNASAQVRVDAEKTVSLLKSDPTIQLIDVRTPAEIAATGTIEGAKTINFNAPDFDTQIEKLDKTKPVIVYCAAGGRSPRAALKMEKMGFKNVMDYAGGMNDWLAKGKKTVK